MSTLCGRPKGETRHSCVRGKGVSARPVLRSACFGPVVTVAQSRIAVRGDELQSITLSMIIVSRTKQVQSAPRT